MTADLYPHLTQALTSRIELLRQSGPGDIAVQRISNIDEVRLLRACDEALDSNEQEWLQAALISFDQQAFGIQVSGFSRLSAEAQQYRPDVKSGGLVDKVASFHARRWLLNRLFPRTNAAREGSPLPAPENLRLAAQAWLTARIAGDRVEGSVVALLKPWEEATVTTQGFATRGPSATPRWP